MTTYLKHQSYVWTLEPTQAAVLRHGPLLAVLQGTSLQPEMFFFLFLCVYNTRTDFFLFSFAHHQLKNEVVVVIVVVVVVVVVVVFVVVVCASLTWLVKEHYSEVWPFTAFFGFWICLTFCPFWSRCNTTQARTAAYELLVVLAENCAANFQFICQQLKSMHHQPDPEVAKQWEVSGGSLLSSVDVCFVIGETILVVVRKSSRVRRSSREEFLSDSFVFFVRFSLPKQCCAFLFLFISHVLFVIIDPFHITPWRVFSGHHDQFTQ